MPDLSAAHPTNTRDGAAVLSERFAARMEAPASDAAPAVPIVSESAAVRLIANWFAPVRAVDEDGVG